MPRAVRFSSYGDPDVLTVVDEPVPEPGPGLVRVAVRAAGVNPADWKIRRGLWSGGKPLQRARLTGFDLAGTVDAVGDGVTQWQVGDRVAGSSGRGASAEYVVAAPGDLAALPDGVDWVTGAAIGVAGKAAIRVLSLAGVRAGQTLLVHAATGGVGTFVTQLAVSRGVTVVGTAGPDNQDHLRSLGAVPVRYGDGWVDRVRAAAPGGVDAVVDAAGTGVLPGSLELCPAGPVVTIADFSVSDPRVVVSEGREPGFEHALADAVAAVAAGVVRIPVAATFPLERTADAHRLSETGHVRGKIVTVV
ncbi:NADP-dependent oxidoreductase [Nakamurella endophytica]|uniref:Oxidoreductase n=1 Tax=Nakamurella endophytica TaxID=1748367 RepID=A0A917WEL8_9ACTN|nr:NADP-dependent oxidoreductase [Nakamurella endophytica]GGM00229.1 oxidoreductase [Nakamurella endophytica]